MTTHTVSPVVHAKCTFRAIAFSRIFATELKHRLHSSLRTIRKLQGGSENKHKAVNLATPYWCGFEKKGSRDCTSRRI